MVFPDGALWALGTVSGISLLLAVCYFFVRGNEGPGMFNALLVAQGGDYKAQLPTVSRQDTRLESGFTTDDEGL